MDTTSIIIRFSITFFLALIFGLERQKSHKPIGFGTFIFVSVGACGLSIISKIIAPENPLPLLGAIVTGIGFLGAGALIKTTDKIFGFTTAAGIWIFSIFGLIIGLGQYLVGVIIYSLVWAVVFTDKYFERKGIGTYRRKVSIKTNKIISLKDLDETLNGGSMNHRLLSMGIDKQNNSCSIIYMVDGTRRELSKTTIAILKKDWCESINFE